MGKKKNRGLLPLAKFVRGAWRIVEYGLPSLRDKYLAQGYIIVRGGRIGDTV